MKVTDGDLIGFCGVCVSYLGMGNSECMIRYITGILYN